MFSWSSGESQNKRPLNLYQDHECKYHITGNCFFLQLAAAVKCDRVMLTDGSDESISSKTARTNCENFHVGSFHCSGSV